MQNNGENIFSSQLGIKVYMQIIKIMVMEQSTSSCPNICHEHSAPHIKTQINTLALLQVGRLTIRLIPSQEFTIILITTWQLQMLWKECPSVNNVKITEDHEPDTFNRVAVMENFS